MRFNSQDNYHAVFECLVVSNENDEHIGISRSPQEPFYDRMAITCNVPTRQIISELVGIILRQPKYTFEFLV